MPPAAAAEVRRAGGSLGGEAAVAGRHRQLLRRCCQRGGNPRRLSLSPPRPHPPCSNYVMYRALVMCAFRLFYPHLAILPAILKWMRILPSACNQGRAASAAGRGRQGWWGAGGRGELLQGAARRACLPL